MRVYRAALVYQRENKNIASVYSLVFKDNSRTMTPIIAISGTIDRCISYCFGLQDAGMNDIKTFIVDSFYNDMSINNWEHINHSNPHNFFVIG